jgi:putative DNA primase/helicase
VEVAPLAVITAPEKRCGKSMLLFLIGRLSRDPLTASNISPAALYRSIELWQPTLLIDEADAFMRDNEELRGLLNCGHTRDSAFTIRCVGDDSTPTRFNLWGAKAIAGIGTLADTLMDRAICLELRRKTPEEVRERLRHAPAGLFEGLTSKMARFRDDYSEAVRTARPNLPKSLNDRAQDNWSGLLAIASCAGNAWLERATTAALKLSGETSDTQSVGNELLDDIQTIFEVKRIERISTADLIAALCEDEELSWNTYNRGKPLSPQQLSKRLKGYGIQSHQYRAFGYANPVRGFNSTDFTEAFARYLSDPRNLPLHVTKPLQPNRHGVCDVTGRNSVTLQSNFAVTDPKDQASSKNDFVTDAAVTDTFAVTKNTNKNNNVTDVTDVTDKNGGAKKEAKGDFVENWGVEL